jgi:hypothetical protein
MPAMKEFEMFCSDSGPEYCECLKAGSGLVFRNAIHQFAEIESWVDKAGFADLFGLALGTDMGMKDAVLIRPKGSESPDKDFAKRQPKLAQLKSAYQIQGKPRRYGDGEKSK